MDITDAQKQAIKKWLAEGCGLSEVQKRLAAEFNLTMTFMDLRFLVIDLGLDVKDRPRKTEKKIGADEAAEDGGMLDAEPDDSAAAGGMGSVRVTLDRVMVPGSIVSGKVAFSDGVTASWSLDQLGRLALRSEMAGYTPSEEDLQAFREELKLALEQRGY